MYYHYEEYDWPEMDPQNYCFEAENDEKAIKHIDSNRHGYKLEEITKPEMKKDHEGVFYLNYYTIRIIDVKHSVY